MIRKLIFSSEGWFRGEASTVGSKNYCYGVFNDGASVAYAMLDSNMREKTTAILDHIEYELTDKEADWQTVVRTYLTQLFIFMGRYINRSIKNPSYKSEASDIICEVIKLIEKEFHDSELSLEGIARRLYISSSKLSRSFKADTGQLFSEYLRNIRLSHSIELLEESDLSVEKVVISCGFKDISTFYRNFRETYGMTPQIYRQVSKSSVKKENNKNNNESEKRKMEICNEISLNVQNGKAKIVKELVQKAIDEGCSPELILNEGLLSAMSIIGEKFKNNEIYVPEVLVSARAMNMGAQILKPHLVASGVKNIGKVCIGTVQGDLHDIGKNLVKMMMEGKGLEVVDLGTDVAAETFVQTAIEQNCRIICCSALLTTTMSVMGDVVKAAEAAGIRDKVKIMVGGAPVNEDFCKKIGADCYSADAASAADAAAEFCKA